MKAAIIPAQIITVEDKIAGNLTLAQIIILMVPLIISMLVYIAIPPLMKFSITKYIISLCIALLSIFLAVRIKGKIIMEWIIILLRYSMRPGYYIYNKNDSYQRIIDLPAIKLKPAIVYTKEKKAEEQKKSTTAITDLIRFEKLLKNPSVSLKFKTNKKGGLHIAIDQIN